ncbi:MAG: Ig-like domain-containing protein [Sediminicola sp.]
MEQKTTIPALTLFFFCFLLHLGLRSQDVVFANAISSQSETDNSSNAIDANLDTKVNVRSSSGLALGIGAYSGHMELQYATSVPPNTTTYIKIDTEDDILPALLSGSLGNLVSDVLGVVLIGNQEFTVQAMDGPGNPVLTGASQIDNDFATDRLRIVTDSANDFYIAISPDVSYDRIRLTSRVGSLVGLGNTKRLGVYGAFYTTGPNECGTPAYTSWDGDGISLDLLGIGGAGVENPHHVLDNDPETYSELNLGILSVLASVEQTVYFEGASNATDNFNISVRLSPSLLAIGALGNVTVIASNNGNVVYTSALSGLVDVDLLTLIQLRANQNLPGTISFSPGAPVDRITVRYSSLLNVEIAQSLDLFDIVRTTSVPLLETDSTALAVCSGNTLDLSATVDPTDLEIRWYDVVSGGTPLATTTSGQSFTTPEITEDTTFYMASAIPGCDVESIRVAVAVEVLQRPSAGDISIAGNGDAICESSEVVLVPSSELSGNFLWYFDADKTAPITDGLTLDGASYTIGEDGILRVNGLMETQSPLEFYTAIADLATGCENAAGDLALATVSIVANTLEPTMALDPNITADDIVNLTESQGTVTITGAVGGDAQIGDTVTLIINQESYSGIVAADFTFAIQVNGDDLAADSNLTIEGVVETGNGSCNSNGSDSETYSVDTSPPTVPTVVAQATNNATPTITGTADSADALTVFVDGISYSEGDGDLSDNGDGTWTLIVPGPNALSEGLYEVEAIATDGAGNMESDLTSFELQIDLTQPVVPTVQELTTNSSTPTISGTVSSMDVLTVTLNGITYSEGDGNLTDNGDGTWTLVVPIGSELPDGTYDIVATATDTAGNIATDLTVDELTINGTAPDNPTVTPLVSNDPSPLIRGTAPSAADLTVTVNGIVYSEGDGNLTDNGDGTWQLQIPDGNGLPDGIYDVRAVAFLGGNSSNDATLNELTIDTAAPTTPTVNALAANDNTPTITGTADSEDSTTVTVNGVTYQEGDGQLTDNGDGTWTLTIPIGNALPDGVFDVEVLATDGAGNTATDNTVDELTVDTQAYSPPTVDYLATNDPTPTITGEATSEGNLRVAVNGVEYVEGDGNLVDNGNGTWSLNVPGANALSDGFYDVMATLTDMAGNSVSDNTVNELIIDTISPNVPTVNVLATNDTTPMLTGTADSPGQLTVEVDGIVYNEGDGNLTDNGDNTWSLQIPTANALGLGIFDVVATVVDIGGNESSDATTDELSIDPSLPSVPVVDFLNTRDTTPSITGTADSEDVLTVTVNGIVYTEGDGFLVDNGNNTWELVIPQVNTLPDGTYDVVATVTDSEGNQVSDNTVDELTIDSNLPTVPTVDPLQTADRTPIVTGSADSEDELTVAVNGVVYPEGDGNLVDNGDGTWALTIPENNALADGIYDVLVTVTAANGFTSVDGTTNELGIGNGTPAIPTVNSITTNDPTPTLEGTAPSATMLTVTLNGIVYSEGDGNLTDNGDGTWTLIIPEENALPEGVYDVIVSTRDDQGVVRTDNTVDEVVLQAAEVSDIGMVKTVDNDNPLTGDMIQFTIMVTNNGNTIFNNIVVSEQLQNGFTYQGHTASSGQYDPNSGIWNISSLGAQDNATLLVSVRVEPTGSHSNTAFVEASIPADSSLDNNSATVDIELNCLTIFNEFSPNNDGFNDYFRIECIERYPDNKLRIYNRNGNKVYEAAGYTNDWTGIANVRGAINNGEMLPAGTYFYVLTIQELGEDRSGWLFIAK